MMAETRQQLATKVEAFKRVLGSVELTAALERGQFSADAYVTLLESTPGENQLITTISQTTRRRIAVVFQVRYAGDPTGDKIVDELEERINQVDAALLGFQPGQYFTPFIAAGGHLVTHLPSAVIWAEEFTTTYLLRSNP